MLFSFPPSFFGVGFCLCVGLQLLYFFSCLLKKIQVLQVCWLTKTMIKKWRATAQSSPPLGLLAVPRGMGLGTFGKEDFIF